MKKTTMWTIKVNDASAAFGFTYVKVIAASFEDLLTKIGNLTGITRIDSEEVYV